MRHHRSPTCSYPQDSVPPIHATLALRHAHLSIPTLLSPLRSIADTPLSDTGDALDDFQSNAWVDAPTYRPPLAGLGIAYLGNASANLYGKSHAPEDSALQMKTDSDEGSFLWSDEIRGIDVTLDGFPAPAVGLESEKNLDIHPAASDVIGLIPDMNMYDDIRRLDQPLPGVNPLDTIRGTSLYDIGICYGEPASLTPKDHHDDDIPLATDSKVEQSPSPRVIQDIMSILVQPASELPFLPWPSVNPPPAQSFSPHHPGAPGSSISIKLESTNAPHSERYASSTPCSAEYPNNTHPSPILNAHLGIELNELVSRAERFRTKHPERDIDRAWLSHFAGKLSDRGELLDDFRCYVIGCDQRNKRRDHILVHVGAHIGQRPFACTVCPLRFLRKNECKRHEASHSGFRPYSCDICGQSFVRQDLVKRHMKRTHELRKENDSGVVRQSRKRARLK